VFSLAAAGPDAFFAEAGDWVQVPSGKSSDVVRELGRIGRSAVEPVLIVIDALEQVQSSSPKDGIGRLMDARVRELVTRCAYGAIPGVAMLVTTRLALTDIEIQRLPLHTKIEMDAMDSAAAIALLRARGVAGSRSERELRNLADSYGRHALTIDLASRYHEQHGSLPSAARTGDQVLRSYLELIADDDRELVGLLSIFPRGVTRSRLAAFAERLGIDIRDGCDEALRRLADMRLATSGPGSLGEDVIAMHEVLRRLVEDDLEEALRRRWHTTVAAGFVEEVSERLRELTLAQRYELLGMCIAHGVAGEDPLWAAELYWNRIGNFALVGHRDSQFAWGESACRALNENNPPSRVAESLRGDPRGVGSAIFADWALYLGFLGELASSLVAHQTAFRESIGDSSLAIAASNVADVSIQRGELPKARDWAMEGRRRALAVLRAHEGMPTEESMRGLDEGFEYSARSELYTTGVRAADSSLESLTALHHEAAEAIASFNSWSFIPLDPAPEFSLDTFQWGVPRAEMFLVSGDIRAAIDLAQTSLQRWQRKQTAEEITSIRIRAVLASALLAAADTTEAIEHIRVMESWARAKDARHTVVHAHLLAAKLARLDGEMLLAAETAAEGLRTARETGSGLLHIELLIESARIALELGEPDDAIYAAATALFGQEPLSPGMALYAAPARDERLAQEENWSRGSGIFPPEDSGRPILLAATHADCGYRWGEAQAREQLGEALLASTARMSGRPDLNAELRPAAARVLAYARGQLEQAAKLFDEVTGTPKSGDRVRRRLDDLNRGKLTEYWSQLSEHANELQANPPIGHRVLISYTRSDSGFVDALADELSRIVDDVWVDRRKVNIGESFVGAINGALRHVTDFIVVLSRDSAKSTWVANELNAAIALRNGGASITIRPVALDGVAVPPLLADLDIVRATDRSVASVLERLRQGLTTPKEA
jgi:hypothetical protein